MPPKRLTGAQGAALVREWLTQEYPAEVVETVVEGLPWRDSPQPLGTRKALSTWYWLEIDYPLRMAKVVGLLRRAQARDW